MLKNAVEALIENYATRSYTIDSWPIAFEEMKGKVAALEDPVPDIQKAISENFEAQRWGHLQIALLLALKVPSKAYTEILCRLLDKRSDNINNDDVASLLGILKDERAVPALSRALEMNFPDDPDFQFNMSCASALWEIGTVAAKAALKKAVDSPYALVREGVAELLME